METQSNEEPVSSSQQSSSESTAPAAQQDVSGYQLVKDREKRQVRQPSKFKYYLVYEGDEEIAGFAYLMTEDVGRPEPGSYQEAL